MVLELGEFRANGAVVALLLSDFNGPISVWTSVS